MIGDNLKVAVCCIAKMENRYIREWIDHYRNLNFDRIIIIDNNDVDGETFDESISDYIENGIVKIINFRGVEKAQFDSYNYVYKNLFKEDWIAFFDVDEFLVLKRHNTIQEYLSVFGGNATDVIKVNWMCYGDCGNLYYEDKPVNERFKDPLPFDLCTCYDFPQDFHTKSIIRNGCHEKNIAFIWNPHVPVGRGVIYRTSDGNLSNSSPFSPYNFDYAYLKHFTTKSLQEFIENKMVKGYPDRPRKNMHEYINTDVFFKWNEKTEEKLKLIEQYNI